MSRNGEFTGEVADRYAKYRRGYREELFDLLSTEFALGEESRVLDLVCGTGQLTIPLAARAGAVVGMDPSADMLALGRAAGRAAGASNIGWLLGADDDVGALKSLLGKAWAARWQSSREPGSALATCPAAAPAAPSAPRRRWTGSTPSPPAASPSPYRSACCSAGP
jgi:SAM-dependent methyltransferase